ncbi:MAG: 23S rRNA (adenine(2503)-C(2))-methyltransferase RlmN [Candidatus Nealsonbacteria bacterium CG_4_9_14_0_2_um_filter_37_38]|uniref:Probable dual-specificity RNA methyltransferase RlmN n=1 Tax=Candidatus Nealsonbacteria bacterium CG_4_10_14_0_8_um_filter_37_14 TaxID=1974684 RepID=A0A2M7R5T3_9BACT|nr:MAG: 23S rRNA (adenine(2503)-C(2))-methyltransferase RlmN [Candidatus Nealsonbacteria bacterium CG11_big_fil_rev_8_21_14_0_20_37_68]PIW91829.1 MAG: 23S rRNA (adenine(2503)-C(2))-methyltransferase RlmN [Candidatus Nealsonbacteria bacterium CG_4_8_14_3_um_filter_37_23]PIY88772.1 MAG: 23S rRNA (adenine(2503)-C(2))-methyltransferase RlmN [Candidatus Nealsonbacteria bacterium CG_4_10_14_0_8_um_filter_37_14]PJC51823.1 MAG: 23S rRNA (adenine(2503)-C(2))-methyltransferase RlmN [Candidatus Nealsonbact
MDLIQFQKLFKKEPGYRLGQAKKALFQDLIQNWQTAKALPLILKEELNKKCPIEVSAKTFVSKDRNTIKALMTLKDGLKIETVLMRHKNKRNTICVSSQVGCSLNCSFCATGKMGFKRNLEAWEIVEQVLFFARYLKKIKERVTNIVFMGMGEPFLNYQNVIGAIKILNDKEGFNLGARHFSVSTVGIVEGIEKLAREELQINLAISLHAPDDKLRSKLMPINKKYPIRKILNAVDDYIAKTRRRVMFEYIMIRNLNDSEENAKTLARLMKKPCTRASTVQGRPLYFVNLISYNPTGIFKPSLSLRIKKFKEILEKEGVTVTQRYRFGQDVEGACGQLAAKDGRK